jgi:transcriptional regulator with XRE-family HTH domain
MPPANPKALGQQIRSARSAAGLSTWQLAAAVDTNQSTIVRIEQGQFGRPSPDLLERISEKLRLPLTDLYALAGIPLPDLQPYLRAGYGLNEADSEQVRRYIARLAAKYGADGHGPAEGVDEQPETQVTRRPAQKGRSRQKGGNP